MMNEEIKKERRGRPPGAKSHAYDLDKEDNIPIYEAIFKWMIEGLMTTTIYHKLNKEFGITQGKGRYYFENAKREIIRTNDDNLAYKRIIATQRYEMLFEKAMELNDYKSAAMIQEKWINLLGIESAKELNINIKSKPAEEMSIREIELILEKNKALEQNNDDTQNADFTDIDDEE